MKMTRELARIKATQYAYEIKYGRHTEPKERVSFEQWFLNGIRNYESKGVEFDLIESGMVRIKWPRKIPVLRSIEDFRREYESMFPAATRIQFEECAGIA